MHLLSQKIDFEIRHDTGKADYKEIKKIYEELNINATVSEFMNDISEAYGWADLVIARAGALTVSELSAVGLPSILIPYPHATDNHQFYNAKFLVDKKAAEMIFDKDLDPDKLAFTVESFFSEKDKLIKASIAAYDETFVQATEKVAEFCFQIIEKEPPVLPSE
jgi:UDP-N-acetylglucosamine--N-acetylmuramyl-(pentapeptide) pyrophosphoryl-undecaprenol N-acetylglucosamine transferase